MDKPLIEPNLLDLLAQKYDDMSAGERRVADFVLADVTSIPRKNLAAIAEGAGVSEPTVLRFCRLVGLDGYAHFKVALAAALAAGGAAYVHRDVSFGDDEATVRVKLIQSSVNALARLQDSLDDRAIARAVDRICAARRLQLLAVGLAGVLALDAQQKFMRLDLVCDAQRDAHLQTMAAATLGPDDVAVALSYNGRIKDVMRAVQTARDMGAYVIAVTRTGSPLAKAADLLIAVDPPEDTFLYAPMTSRLSHLVVIDLIATMVALRRGPDVVPQLERIKESLSDQWIAERGRPKRRPANTTASSVTGRGERRQL